MTKAVTLFLIGMLAMAMFGKLRFPGQKRLQAAKCAKCGRYKLSKKPCDCTAGKI